MSELVASAKGQLDSNSKCLDRHDGDRANGRADGEVDEGILLSIFWSYPVYHDEREHENRQAEYQEALDKVSRTIYCAGKNAYQVGLHSGESHRWSQSPCPAARGGQ
jgi:hypothetical protein